MVRAYRMLLVVGMLAASGAQAAYELAIVGEPRGISGPRVLSCTNALGATGPRQIVGMRVRAGTFVDQITLLCQNATHEGLSGEIRSDATSPISAPLVVLPGVSSREQNYNCPTGYVLAGIKARGGDYVDRIASLRCVQYGGTTIRTVNVGMGGTGGYETRPYCNSGDRVNSIETTSGAWLDSFRIVCTQNVREPAPRKSQDIRMTAPTKVPLKKP